MRKAFFALGLVATLLGINAQAEETDAAPAANKVKVETIRVQDNFGTLEEERVAAMRSEIRYVPQGSDDGYNLIGSEESQSTTQNAHQNDDMLIPSWNLFSW